MRIFDIIRMMYEIKKIKGKIVLKFEKILKFFQINEFLKNIKNFNFSKKLFFLNFFRKKKNFEKKNSEKFFSKKIKKMEEEGKKYERSKKCLKNERTTLFFLF